MVVRLLETTRMRVGNDEYARENESVGLTTLRTRQVRCEGCSFASVARAASRTHSRLPTAGSRPSCDLPGYDLDGSLAQAMTERSLDACVKRLLGRRPQARSLGPLLKKSLRRLRRCGTQLAGTAAHPPP